MASVDDAPTLFKLSRELTPRHEGGVQAACVLHDGSAVTGADDHTVKIWPATAAGFGDPVYCVGFGGMVRALLPLPVLSSFPEGGFVAACLDKSITLWSKDGTLVKTLRGHTGGVVDLDWTASGGLLSGSWDGTARVWDVETGACTATLDDHENAVCVLGLSNGDIVTGTTGKNVDNKHVGFRVRIWRGGAVVTTLDDHEGPIRCLTEVPGLGFVSTSNDGTAKVRDLSGSVLATLANPPAGDKLGTAYRAVWVPDNPAASGAAAASGCLVTANEDTVLRVYRDNAMVQEIPHPGTPWTAALLPNGDLVTVCNHAGTSKYGHVYVWSRDPARHADDDALGEFAKAMTPEVGSNTGAGGGGVALGADAGPGSGADELRPLGPYERRHEFKGTAPGALAYFTKPDHTVWMCAWDAAEGAWTDFGEVEGIVPQERFDVERDVTIDMPDGALHSMPLKFNIGDDPATVAKEFMTKNGVSIDQFEQVRDYIMKERELYARQRGLELAAPAVSNVAYGAGAAAGAGGPAALPSTSYISVSSIKFDKALEKLAEFNADVAASAPSQALSDANMTAMKALAAMLKQTSRYHATRVTDEMRAAVAKVLAWPAQYLLPAIDIVRVMVTHPHGAEVFAEHFGSDAACTLITTASKDGTPPAVSLLVPRLLFNLFAQRSTRSVAEAVLLDLLVFAKELLAKPGKAVRNAAVFLLTNCCRLLTEKHAALGAAAFNDAFSLAANQAVDGAVAALRLDPALEPGPLLNALEAGVHAAKLGSTYTTRARTAGLKDAASAAVAASGASGDVGVKAKFDDLAGVLG